MNTIPITDIGSRKMADETIAAKWQLFATLHGLSSPEITKQEYEDAKFIFYAGAMEMLSAVIEDAEEPPTHAHRMWGWCAEIGEFITQAGDRIHKGLQHS